MSGPEGCPSPPLPSLRCPLQSLPELPDTLCPLPGCGVAAGAVPVPTGARAPSRVLSSPSGSPLAAAGFQVPFPLNQLPPLHHTATKALRGEALGRGRPPTGISPTTWARRALTPVGVCPEARALRRRRVLHKESSRREPLGRPTTAAGTPWAGNSQHPLLPRSAEASKLEGSCRPSPH